MTRGMMHGATVYQLGSLLPEQENPLKDTLAKIDALEQEVVGDMRVVSDEGHDVTSFKVEYNTLSAQALTLAGEFTILDEDHIATWKGRANAVVNGLMDMLGRLGTAKQGGFTLAGRRGLFWGLGTSAVVAVLAFFVWRGKRRRRVR